MASSVIASEAKQSSFAATRKLDCFVAQPVIGRRIRADPLAPRNDGVRLMCCNRSN
jgi:hypothetical protein